MAQWVNRLQNNVFVNLPSLPLLCEISGSETRSYGRQVDELQMNFEIFQVGCRSKYSTCHFV